MTQKPFRQRALEFGLQLTVVVLGVTISLGLDEWRSNRGEARAASALKGQLAADLRSDLDELEASSYRTRRMIRAYQRLLAPEAAAMPDDSLDRYVDLAVSYILFPAHDEAYEAMRQTGSSQLLRDPDLRSAIIRHYTRTHGRAAEWDDINRQFILERMIPYVEANAPELRGESVEGEVGLTAWAGLASSFRALDDQAHFRNLLRTNLLFKEAQLSVYEATRQETEDLLARLAPE